GPGRFAAVHVAGAVAGTGSHTIVGPVFAGDRGVDHAGWLEAFRGRRLTSTDPTDPEGAARAKRPSRAGPGSWGAAGVGQGTGRTIRIVRFVRGGARRCLRRKAGGECGNHHDETAEDFDRRRSEPARLVFAPLEVGRSVPLSCRCHSGWVATPKPSGNVVR